MKCLDAIMYIQLDTYVGKNILDRLAYVVAQTQCHARNDVHVHGSIVQATMDIVAFPKCWSPRLICGH